MAIGAPAQASTANSWVGATTASVTPNATRTVGSPEFCSCSWSRLFRCCSPHVHCRSWVRLVIALAPFCFSRSASLLLAAQCIGFGFDGAHNGRHADQNMNYGRKV